MPTPDAFQHSRFLRPVHWPVWVLGIQKQFAGFELHRCNVTQIFDQLLTLFRGTRVVAENSLKESLPPKILISKMV